MPEVFRNQQAENIFNRWGVTFRLVEEFPLADIQDIDGQQVRDQANRANATTVEEYFQQYQNGAAFPPIVLAEPGTIIDGNTRLAMAHKAKLAQFPAYLVRVPSIDLAKALGAALNQMAGVRLTEVEAYKAALDMMGENLNFTDAQIAQVTGKAAWQIKQFRAEREAAQHAERTRVEDALANVPKTQHKMLALVKQDAPFRAAVELAGSRRLPNATVKKMVEEVRNAPSETEALELVAAVAADNPAGGPGATAVVRNTRAHRMRMVLPQIINMRPPEDLYEADKASEDEKLWREVRRVVDNQLSFYERMTPAMSFPAPAAEEEVASFIDEARS